MPTINKPKKQYQSKNQSQSYKNRQKIYKSKQWKELRAAKLMQNPLCEECLKAGKTTPAADVHHIKSPFNEIDPNKVSQLAYDYNNLKSLCKECHGKLHSKSKNIRSSY